MLKAKCYGQHKIEHSGNGILDFIAWMQALAKGHAGRIAASIEVPRGPIHRTERATTA